MQNTGYGIYLPAPIDRWIGVRQNGCDRYVERQHAIGFETAMRATIMAIEFLQLDPKAFEVRPL